MKLNLAVIALALAAAPASAQDAGDPAEGEKVFRQCIACHVVQNDAGELLAGRAGKTGPNLFGVIGRKAGAVEGFRYSKAIEEAGEKGLVWTEETIVPYLHDPTAFLRDYSGDAAVRSNMTLKLRDEQQAKDVYAYLASLMPAAN